MPWQVRSYNQTRRGLGPPTGWAFVILAAWGGTYQSVDRDVVNLLRPHCPAIIWHAPGIAPVGALGQLVPYSAERAAEVRSRHGRLNVYSYRALDTPSEELKLMEFRRSAWEFEAPRFIRCEHAEEARWIAGAANSVTHTRLGTLHSSTSLVHGASYAMIRRWRTRTWIPHASHATVRCPRGPSIGPPESEHATTIGA